MLWAPLIVLLGTWCTGSSSQLLLTQPPSVSVSPGNTMKLSCTMSSGTSISGYAVSWYQQKPGNSPQYLLYYYMDTNKGQGSGVPARFSGNAGYLTISGALAEDEADYYCAVRKRGTGVLHCDTDRWGSETKTSFPPLPRPGPCVQTSPVAQFCLWLRQITQQFVTRKFSPYSYLQLPPHCPSAGWGL
uniref:Ig-like domain-containing protein n=1 Tax=Chrysemys picta bellii TaxID=8478 RepID=A0A8C3FXU6_CHRPI